MTTVSGLFKGTTKIQINPTFWIISDRVIEIQIFVGKTMSLNYYYYYCIFYVIAKSWAGNKLFFIQCLGLYFLLYTVT